MNTSLCLVPNILHALLCHVFVITHEESQLYGIYVLEAVVAQWHKRMAVTATVIMSILTRGNEFTLCQWLYVLSIRTVSRFS